MYCLIFAHICLLFTSFFAAPMIRIVSALALTAVLLLFPLRTGWGCCFGDPEYWLVLFDSEKLLPPHQQKFMFTTHLLHTPNLYPQDGIPRQNRIEWEQALQMAIDSQDFVKVLYQNAFDTAIWAGNLGALAISPMATALCKRREMADYLRMVRTGEQLQQVLYDPWEGDNAPGQDSALAICLRRMQTSPHAFLQQRYAYQALRFSYNIGDFQAVIDLFEGSLRAEQSPYLHHEALHYVIRSAYRLGQIDRGNYLAALLFDTDSDINHLSTYLNLDDDRWVQPTLKRAPTDQDRAKVFALKAYQCIWHARPWVDSVVRYDPANASLPLLVMREVNKAENWLLGPMVTQQYAALDTTADYSPCGPYTLSDDFVRKNYAKDRQYIRQFKQWLAAQFPRFQPNDRPVMALALAHLCYLLQEQSAGEAWLARAQHGSRKDPAFLQQAEKEAFLLLTLGDIRQPALQQRLVKLLENQFRQHKGMVPEKRWRDDPESRPEWLYYVLRARFRQLGDITNMAWLDTKTTRYAEKKDDDDIFRETRATLHEFGTADHALAFLAQVEGKQPLSPLQQHCFTPGLRAHVREWIDLSGSLLLLENRLPEALAQYEKIPDGFFRTAAWGYLDEDPFVTELFQARDLSKEGKPFPRNGKKEVVRRMIALQTEAEQIPAKKAANYLLLGYAWYNMSVYGNSWMMTQRQWSSYEHYDDVDRKYGQKKPHQSQVNAPYYDARYARQCFQTAFEAAQANGQRELAAESGLCAQLMQTHPQGAYSDWSRREKEQILRNLKEYKDTKFLRHYRSTCLY